MFYQLVYILQTRATRGGQAKVMLRYLPCLSNRGLLAPEAVKRPLLSSFADPVDCKWVSNRRSGRSENAVRDCCICSCFRPRLPTNCYTRLDCLFGYRSNENGAKSTP